MIEYNRHIEEYLNYGYSSFSKLISPKEWGNKQVAERYLAKYWLPEEEYIKIWKPIQDKIFKESGDLSDSLYLSDFQSISVEGGCLFTKEDFEQLQNAIKDIGESYIVIIQNSQEFTEGEPMFKMKFPSNITWKELTSGNYISAVLFEMNYNEYFVFGANGNWGKYSATDSEEPLDIIGFKSKYSKTFEKYFK